MNNSDMKNNFFWDALLQ